MSDLRNLINKLDSIETGKRVIKESTEQQLDEFLPLIPMAVAGAAGYFAGKNNGTPAQQPAQQPAAQPSEADAATKARMQGEIKELISLIDQYKTLKQKKPSTNAQSTPAANPPTPTNYGLTSQTPSNGGLGLKAPQPTSESTLAKDLIESFGMLTESQQFARQMFLEEGIDPLLEFGMSDVWEWAKDLGINVLQSLKKVGLPITVAYEVYQGWQEIKALDKKMPRAQFKSQVAKIITKRAGQFGLVWFGSLIGSVVAGTIGLETGPGAVLFAIAGGIAAAWKFGDDADAMAESLVDFFYPEGSDEANPAQSNQSQAQNQQQPNGDTSSVPGVDPHGKSQAVVKVQTALKSAGMDLGSHGIDGYFGPDTLKAFQSYKQAKHLENTPDLELIMQLAGAQPVSESKLSDVDLMSSLKQRLAQLEAEQLDEKYENLTSLARHSLAPIFTTAGMKAVKDLGQTVKAGGKTWRYNKDTGDYHGPGGQRKSVHDMKDYKAQADVNVIKDGEQATLQDQRTGNSYTYSYNAKTDQWTDARGKPVSKGIDANLRKQAIEKNKAEYEQSKSAPAAADQTKNAAAQPQAAGNAPAAAKAGKGKLGKAQNAINAVKQSRFANVLKSPAGLSIIAALGTLGYLFNKDGNILNGGVEAPADPADHNQAVTPGADASNDQTTPAAQDNQQAASTDADNAQELKNLRNRMTSIINDLRTSNDPEIKQGLTGAMTQYDQVVRPDLATN